MRLGRIQESVIIGMANLIESRQILESRCSGIGRGYAVLRSENPLCQRQVGFVVIHHEKRKRKSNVFRWAPWTL